MKTQTKQFAVLFSFAFAVFVLTNQTQADDWLQWRGPNHNSVSTETGLLKKWPAEGPPQLWANEDCGIGYGGFSIKGNRLFTIGANDGVDFALCLNTEDGSQIWRTPFIGGDSTLSDRGKGWGDGPRSTPSVDGDFVFLMGVGGELWCVKAEDGAKVWSVNMADFGGSTPGWGYSESPLVDEDKVICTPGGPDGTLVALDKRTGKKIWQSAPVTKTLSDGSETNPAKAHYSSIIPIDSNNQRQYVQLLVHAVVSVNADSGETVWQINWSGNTAVIPTPIFNNDEVYVTSGYKVGSKLIKIGENNEATELWHTKAMSNHHGGVIQIGDYFYGSNEQVFVCQSRTDGKAVWQTRKLRKGALTYADGLFYHLGERSGKVTLFHADENGISMKGRFTMEPKSKIDKRKGKIWVHPVIANGRLYLRDQNVIVSYDVKSK
ncbi:MAG: PQQ-binding-like beta-propeller repeat protein [Mariniblastus sp.]